jgi:hypothetical protein
VPGVIAVVRVLGDILINFSLQCCQQHTSGALAHQSIEIELQRILLGLVRGDYAQHAAYLLSHGSSAVSGPQQPGGYAAILTAPIHNFLTGMLMDGSGF